MTNTHNRAATMECMRFTGLSSAMVSVCHAEYLIKTGRTRIFRRKPWWDRQACAASAFTQSDAYALLRGRTANHLGKSIRPDPFAEGSAQLFRRNLEVLRRCNFRFAQWKIHLRSSQQAFRDGV